MKSSILVIVFCTIFSLSACGGGSGGSRPEIRPSGAIDGVAFDNILIDSDITVYSLSGDVLATGKTDSEGLYSVELTAIPSQIVKIEARNGSYREEYSGRIVELQEVDVLYSFIEYTQGGNVSTAVTLYSTIAAGYAEYLMSLGVSPLKAVKDANASVAQMIGVDITKVMPVNIMDPQNAKPSLTNSLQYSFFTAAVSPLTAWMSRENGQIDHEFYNSIRFARLAYHDIRYDGLLDGQGEDGLITMGVVILNENIYRNQLALNMLIIANHPNNKSGMTPADLQPAANAYNQSNHPSFGESVVIPLDAQKPVITNANWENNQTMAGLLTFEVDVADAVGIESLVLNIDETDLPVDDIEEPSWTINSVVIDDGNYTVTITATNFAGGESVFIRNVIIANQGITVSNLIPEEGQHIRGTFNFQATVTDPIAVQSVTFTFDDSFQYSPENINTPSQNINTLTTIAAEGAHTFHVLGVNQGNFEDEKEITFYVDNTSPNIDWDFVNDSLVQGDFIFSATISDNLNLASAVLFLDGEVETDFVTGVQTSVSPNYSIAKSRLNEGLHNVVIEAKDKAGAIKNQSREFMVDFYNPTIAIYDGDHIVTGAYALNFGASDTNAVDRIEIYEDDVLIATVAGSSISKTITPSQLTEEGSKTIKVVAIDVAGKSVYQTASRHYYHIPITSFSTSYTEHVSTPYYGFKTFRFEADGVKPGSADTGIIEITPYAEGNYNGAYIKRGDNYFDLVIKEPPFCYPTPAPAPKKARFTVTVTDGDFTKTINTPFLGYAYAGNCGE